MTARRLAAILAADVVGYSRLMGEDEAGTALSVRAHREAARPLVAGFGGRIVKTTGDGLLLEFPSVVAAVGSHSDPETHGRTKFGDARGQADRLPHRCQSRRRVDRGRRYSWRRGEHRGEVGRPLRARRRLISSAAYEQVREGNISFRRSRFEATQEHRAAGAHLLLVVMTVAKPAAVSSPG